MTPPRSVAQPTAQRVQALANEILVDRLRSRLDLWRCRSRIVREIIEERGDERAQVGPLAVHECLAGLGVGGIAIGLAALGGIVGAEFLPIEPYYALRYMVTFLVVGQAPQEV